MADLGLSIYDAKLEQANTSSSFDSLKKLYNLANAALETLAAQSGPSEKTGELEDKFIADKQFLLRMATDIQCKDERDIFEKIDFLNHVYLDEKVSRDFTPEDHLLKSIYADCQNFL